MITLYLVQGCQGRYDERSWIACACATRELAEAWVLHLQTAVDALCTRDTFEGKIIHTGDTDTLGPVAGDPESYFTMHGGRCQYDVVEVETRDVTPTPAVPWKEEIIPGAPSEHRYRSIMPDNVSLVAYDHGDWYVVGPNWMKQRDIAKGACNFGIEVGIGSEPRIEFAKDAALQAYLAWKQSGGSTFDEP